MEMLARLQEDMKSAMKTGQKDRLGVIRMLINDVKNIDLAPKPTTAEEAVASYGKKLKKALDEYQRLGKDQEVEKLRFEISVVEQYVPKKASPQETEKLVNEFLAKSEFTEKQFGQAMGAFMKAHGSVVDPGVANQLLRKGLAGK